MIIDVKTNQPIAEMPSGVQGFISYTRLVEQLRMAGEFKPHETITHLQLDNNGISYRVDDRKRSDR